MQQNSNNLFHIFSKDNLFLYKIYIQHFLLHSNLLILHFIPLLVLHLIQHFMEFLLTHPHLHYFLTHLPLLHLLIIVFTITFIFEFLYYRSLKYYLRFLQSLLFSQFIPKLKDSKSKLNVFCLLNLRFVILLNVFLIDLNHKNSDHK